MQVLPQAQKLHVYGSGRFGAFGAYLIPPPSRRPPRRPAGFAGGWAPGLRVLGGGPAGDVIHDRGSAQITMGIARTATSTHTILRSWISHRCRAGPRPRRRDASARGVNTQRGARRRGGSRAAQVLEVHHGRGVGIVQVEGPTAPSAHFVSLS